MKSEQIQTASIVIIAMVAGGALVYFLTGKSQPAPAPAPVVTSVPAARTDAVTTVNPQSRLEAQVLKQNDAIDDAAFDAAVSRAREARKAGTLKPLASTPEEFAMALGALNFRIHDYSVRYTVPPAEGSPEAATAAKEMDKLMEDLANLFSDDSLLEKLNDGTPAELAKSQAAMAAGALGLDQAGRAKVEEIIAKTYAEAMPLEGKELTAEQEAEFEKKMVEANERMLAQILETLTPDQRTRFDALGADQVLFGLSAEEE